MRELVSRRELLTVAGGSALLSATAAGAVPATEPPRLPCNVVAQGLSPEQAQQIVAISPQITLVQPNSDAERRKALADAHVLFGSLAPEELPLAPKLRWFQYGAAGVEHQLWPEFVASPILLTNAKGCYAPAISEHVFGLLFGLTRGTAQQAQQMLEHKWGGHGGYIELRGLTMGIVGFGGIGRETARKAKAMDMHVIAVDAEPLYREHFATVDSMALVEDGLHDLMRQADVVVSAAPHTKRSEGMFGAAEFALMKPTAYFINVSRGKLVQTDALVAALKEKRIAGAGLDVTNPEPLPPDHALWTFPNVIVTSHIAGQSPHSWERSTGVFVENVRRYVHGQPLLNLVDKQKGY